jgi:hypothetical protein
MQDRCIVYAEHTKGLEIILDAPNGTPKWHGSCGISFWYIQSKIGAQFAPNVP